MASKRATSQFVRPAQAFSFSTSEEAAAPSKEEIDAGRAEWGIKYDDEALKFEKEWKEIADKVEAE